jgi:hypothetical protein
MFGPWTVSARAQCAAVPEKVWTVLTDAPSWTSWAGCHEAVVESGHDLTEVRRFKVAPLPAMPWLRITSRERTTVYDPPAHWGYVMLSGPPGITDYAADVRLEPTDAGGTTIHWQVTFRSPIPGLGPLVRRILSGLYGRTAQGLAGAAQRPGRG